MSKLNILSIDTDYVQSPVSFFVLTKDLKCKKYWHVLEKIKYF